MLVTLKRNWFSPHGERFRVRDNPVQMSSDLFDALPSDAVIDGKVKKDVDKNDLDKPDVAPREVKPQAAQTKTK